MFFNIEEAVVHLAGFGVKKEDLKLKVIQNQLIKYPTSLQVFHSDYCEFYKIFRDFPATFATISTATRILPCSILLTHVALDVARRREEASL